MERDEAIEMLLNRSSDVHMNISVDCNLPEQELEAALSDLAFDLCSFRDECRVERMDIEEKRKELNKLMTHEVYEIGERRGLWKIREKQRRLI